jgi:hypothetical protein
MESYLRDWAVSELGVMFKIDNSTKAEDDFMALRLSDDVQSDLSDRTVITMHTSSVDGMKFQSFFILNIKDGVVNTACPDLSVYVSEDQHDVYNPATARLLVAFYSMMEHFLPSYVKFECGYTRSFGDVGFLGDCLRDEEAIRISRNISIDVKKYCIDWMDRRNSVGGKSAKVKKARETPY